MDQSDAPVCKLRVFDIVTAAIATTLTTAIVAGLMIGLSQVVAAGYRAGIKEE